jgi:hypothetical protein
LPLRDVHAVAERAAFAFASRGRSPVRRAGHPHTIRMAIDSARGAVVWQPAPATSAEGPCRVVHPRMSQDLLCADRRGRAARRTTAPHHRIHPGTRGADGW